MLSAILYSIGAILLIVVIINRFKQKKNEDFTNRKN